MKKVICMGLALAMAFSMVACGGSSSSAASSEASDASSSTAAEGAVKIGGTGPLTGGAAIYGNAAKRGAEIAVEEINALGGLQFDLKYEDDTHDAEKAVNAYNTLKDWGMQVFLGSVTSTPCVATSAESNGDHIFLLTPSASSTDVLGGVANPLTGTIDVPRKDNAFQMCFMDPNQGAASAQYISEKNLGTKIAIIYKNDDVYSTGIYNSFMNKAQELGHHHLYLGQPDRLLRADQRCQKQRRRSAVPAHVLRCGLSDSDPGQQHRLCAQVLRRGRHGRHSDPGRLRQVPG